MKTWLVLLSLVMPGAWANEALEGLHKAQQHYLNGEYPQMLEELRRTLEIKPVDPLIATRAVDFANRYYATNPKDFGPSLPVGKGEASLALEMTQHAGRPSYYEFTVDMRTPSLNLLRELKMRLPDGRETRIYDKDMPSEAYESTREKGSFVRRMRGEKLALPLPTGLYLLTFKWSDGGHFEMPWFIAPSNKDGIVDTPSVFPRAEIDRKSRRLKWSAPRTSMSSFSGYRCVWVNIYKEGSDTPIFTKFIERKEEEKGEFGELELQLEPGLYRLEIERMDSLMYYVERRAAFPFLYRYRHIGPITVPK